MEASDVRKLLSNSSIDGTVRRNLTREILSELPKHNIAQFV